MEIPFFKLISGHQELLGIWGIWARKRDSLAVLR